MPAGAITINKAEIVSRPARAAGTDRVAALPAATVGPAFAAFIAPVNEALPGAPGAQFRFCGAERSHLLAGADTLPARRSTLRPGCTAARPCLGPRSAGHFQLASGIPLKARAAPPRRASL